MNRICILRRDYYPGSPHVRRDAQALLADGYEVDVVSLRAPGEKSREVVDGIRVYRLPISRSRSGLLHYMLEYLAFFLLAFFALSFLQMRRRYRCIEVDTMPDFLVYAALVPKLLGAKVVLYLFECMPEMFEDGYNLPSTHPVVRLLRFIERHASRFADHVIYLGPSARALQEPRVGKPIQGTVVLNVPPETIFSPQKSTPPRARLDDGPYTVITHGSLLERYAISSIIEAVSMLKKDIPDIRLIIAGEGEDRPNLERLTAKLGLNESVTFTGRVSQERCVELISSADVGVAAFLHDWGFSWKLFEYMALRRPVVHSATKSTLDYCQNDEVRFFPPGDVTALAAEFRWVYEHPEERLAMLGRADKLYEISRWGVTRRAYLDVYSGLIRADDPIGTPDRPAESADDRVGSVR